MNHILNVFEIYDIDLLRFGKLGFRSPSVGDIVLRKMIKLHHPLDFSWYHNLWALFTSGRGRQKVDGTTYSLFSKTWLSCRGLYLYLGQGWTRGKLVVYFSSLPLLEFFGSGLLMWAGPFGLGCVHPIFEPTKWTSMTHIAMGFHPLWTLIISEHFGFWWIFVMALWAMSCNI